MGDLPGAEVRVQCHEGGSSPGLKDKQVPGGGHSELGHPPLRDLLLRDSPLGDPSLRFPLRTAVESPDAQAPHLSPCPSPFLPPPPHPLWETGGRAQWAPCPGAGSRQEGDCGSMPFSFPSRSSRCAKTAGAAVLEAIRVHAGAWASSGALFCFPEND